MKKIELINVNLLDINLKMQLNNWRNQDFIRKYMFNKNVISEEEHLKYLKSLESCNKEKQVFICFIDEVPQAVIQYYIYNGNYEVGYYLINEMSKGIGIAKLTEYILLEYMFGKLGVPFIVSRTLIENKTGIGFQESMGFKELETEDCTICLQGLSIGEWKKVRLSFKNLLQINGLSEIVICDYSGTCYEI